jgi:plastocyanin
MAALVSATAFTSSCSARKARPQIHQVAIRDMQFVPAELSVAKSDVIVWTNEDYFPHTATAAGVFDSKAIESKHQWKYQAEQTGEIRYVCTLHPSMDARLVVR